MADGTRSNHLSTMDNWKSIRLELASTREFPAGSVSRAYLIRLPLDDEDRVDEAAFLESPSRAMVSRYWSSEPDERGKLVKADGTWIIKCNGKPCRRLELDRKPVRLGQQLTLLADEGEALPFRIASIW